MADAIESIPIPDTPPSGYGASVDSMRGIAALKKACIDGGLTSKYAICSMLGIAGIESKWIPIVEGQYSAKNLIGKGATPEEAAKYARKGVSPQEHFGFVYGTLKHKSPAEGQYFGRGFIQLTWYANYKKFGDKSGLDLVNNPDLLIGTDDATMARCAKVCVEFFKGTIKNCLEAQHRPDFINKALSAVNSKDPHNGKKITCYEYFLGGKAAAPPTNKDAASTAVNKTQSEIDTASPNKREAYSEDRSANFSTVGFTDPEGKYPLRDYMNEPDTNRLARGILDGTSVNFKDSTRQTDIPIANGADGGTWDQPSSSYNTVYPYNKVMESESGHVLEFDDSPDGERVNLYHRKGTFIEIDPNGSQVNYIVGDGFYITENNGNIFINGACNITTGSNCNILVQGNANIEVDGTSDIVLHDTVNIGCATDLNLAVGGDYNILVEGNYNVEVGKTSNTRSIGTMSIESTDALKLKTAKTISMEGGDTASTAETLMKMSSSFKLETPADFQIKAKSFTLDIEDATHIKTGSFKTQTTSGKLELKVASELDIIATGDILLDTPHFDVNGTPVSISSIDSLSPLGAPKVPVNFAGDAIEGRGQEQVLVDTVLTPAGEYNPNTLSDTVIDSVLNELPIPTEILSAFGGSAPDIYDVKYVAPIERKTTLSAAGAAKNHRLVVPPRDSSHKTPNGNLVPPERHSDSVSKYENAEDWNTPEGQKAWNKISTTSDYENNNVVPDIPTDPEENVKGTGGSSATSTLSTEKLADINGKEDYPLSYPLSKHFTLGMLVVGTNKFKAQKVGSTFYTKQMIVANLCELCENVLEPIWNEFGPCRGGGQGATWYLAEGFRSQATEGGSATSHHLAGRAADIHLIPDTKDAIFDAAVKIEKIVPYQEFFMEYARGGASHWIHISYDRNNKSKELQTWVQHSKRSNGLVKLYSGNTK